MTSDIKDSILKGFLESVDQGLSKQQKTLSSQYFYDDEGSRIFKRIMDMPTYYLTNSEYEILDQQAGSILEKLPFNSRFNIVELGAGDGMKTIRLLNHFQNSGVDFRYMPIDISEEAITMLQANVAKTNQDININALVGDYFDMLESLKNDSTPTLLLFLGSNLGNFHLNEATTFIQKLSDTLKPGDCFLLGLDLQKNPHTIRNAYNDPEGITRAFNLNLLKRINRELGGNFNLDQWEFYSSYHPINGEVRSYLISLQKQTVFIEKLNKSYSFQENELIYTELSRKYTLIEIENIAKEAGLLVDHYFLDSKKYFVDALLAKG